MRSLGAVAAFGPACAASVVRDPQPPRAGYDPPAMATPARIGERRTRANGRRRSAIAIAAVAATALVAIGCDRHAVELPVLPPDSTAREVEAAIEPVVAERVVVEAPAPVEVPVPEPEPAAVVAEVREVLPRLEFDPDALVCEQIPREVAVELAKVPIQVQRAYEASRGHPKVARSQLAMDRYVLAVWPRLRELVEQGKIQVRVRRNKRTRSDGGTFSYWFHVSDKECGIAGHLPNFAVSFALGRDLGFPEMFDEIFAEAERECGR